MRLVKTSELQEGMILAKNITCNGQVLVSNKRILTQDVIEQLHLYTNQVYVYELDDSFEAILGNTNFTMEYLNHVFKLVEGLTDVSLNDEKSFMSASNFIHKFLSSNREALYQLLVLEEKHPYTLNHSLNVAMYGITVGLAMGLSTKELADLLIGGILHDIGKLKISNSILDKASSLDTKEIKAIKLHPIYGVKAVEDCPYITANVRDIILQHHEKLDGSGYPYGLKGNQINYLAQIITVCDIFDAVISKRAYHSVRSTFSGAKILLENADSDRLDKTIVSNLLNQVCLFKRGHQVVLSNGESGYVVQDCKGLKPIIKTVTNKVLDLSILSNVSVVSA